MPVLAAEAAVALLPYVIDGVHSIVRTSLAAFNRRPRAERARLVRQVLQHRALFVFPGLALAAQVTAKSPEGVDLLVSMLEEDRPMKKNPELPFAFAVHAPHVAPRAAAPRAQVRSEWTPKGDDLHGVLLVAGTRVIAVLKPAAHGRLHLRARWAINARAAGKYNALVPASSKDPVAWAEQKLASAVSDAQQPRVFDWETPHAARKKGKVR